MIGFISKMSVLNFQLIQDVMAIIRTAVASQKPTANLRET